MAQARMTTMRPNSRSASDWVNDFLSWNPVLNPATYDEAWDPVVSRDGFSSYNKTLYQGCICFPGFVGEYCQGVDPVKPKAAKKKEEE